MTQDAALGPATLMSRVGRPHEGWVNTPVTRASTYVFDTTRQWREVRAQREDRRMRSYGARGTDSTHALEDAVTSLEGGARAQLFPTGQAAIAVLMAGILKAGDHVLVTDAVYEPVRRFCSGQLARQGVDVEYYLPDGSDLEARIGPRTRLIYAETPGSLAFEMMDMPKVAALARRSDCLLAVDNTWGSGVLYRPLDHGADLSIIAATKYLGGHADVMMGAVVANAHAWPVLQSSAIEFGQTVGADDAYLVLRGMRSLLPRLRAHAQGAAVVADWLAAHPAVARLHCLSRPDHPGHALWKRDCHGMNGLMTAEFHPGTPTAEIDRALDRMRLFGIGASWGGFESLAVPVDMTRARTVADWSGHGPMIRLHVGLEDPGDLIADLAQALASLG